VKRPSSRPRGRDDQRFGRHATLNPVDINEVRVL